MHCKVPQHFLIQIEYIIIIIIIELVRYCSLLQVEGILAYNSVSSDPNKIHIIITIIIEWVRYCRICSLLQVEGILAYNSQCIIV